MVWKVKDDEKNDFLKDRKTSNGHIVWKFTVREDHLTEKKVRKKGQSKRKKNIKTLKNGSEDIVQVIDCLPSMCEALGSMPCSTKKKFFLNVFWNMSFEN
jgi:hypothetical protein